MRNTNPEATQLYLNLKGTEKSKTLKQAVVRNFDCVIDLLDDRDINY